MKAPASFATLLASSNCSTSNTTSVGDPVATTWSGSSPAAVIDAKLFNSCPTAGVDKLCAARCLATGIRRSGLSRIGHALTCPLFVRFEIGVFGFSGLGWSDPSWGLWSIAALRTANDRAFGPSPERPSDRRLQQHQFQEVTFGITSYHRPQRRPAPLWSRLLCD